MSEQKTYTRAIGLDREYHDWDELTDEEKALWLDEGSRADLKHEYRKYHSDGMTLAQSIIEREKMYNLIQC